jgi:hypothetical protein
MHDATLSDPFVEGVLWGLLYSTPRPASQTDWEECRRTLAFLKSDLESRRIPLPADEEPRFIPFHYLHLAALAAAGLAAWYVGWWVFVAVWIVSGTLGIISLQFHGRSHEAERVRRYAYYPFVNEQEWLDHERLLETCRLPTFEDWHRKHPTSFVSRFSVTWFWVLIVGTVALLFVGSVMMWPLFVVVWLIAKFFPGAKGDESACAPSAK